MWSFQKRKPDADECEERNSVPCNTVLSSSVLAGMAREAIWCNEEIASTGGAPVLTELRYCLQSRIFVIKVIQTADRSLWFNRWMRMQQFILYSTQNMILIHAILHGHGEILTKKKKDSYTTNLIIHVAQKSHTSLILSIIFLWGSEKSNESHTQQSL